MKKKSITINFKKGHLFLAGAAVIITAITGAVFWARAAFIEPDFAPEDSDQDFAQNILGANNTNNEFLSDAVSANNDGSIIERLEYFTDYIFTKQRVDNAYGRGWVASSSGDASAALTKAACEAASDWQWFEDGNGDGDYDDPEDGICVLTAHRQSANWGGTETNDNTYIIDYDCTGSFPSGTTTDAADNSCALCVADCYDGRKDLPDQGGYTSPDTSCTADPNYEECYEGPITEEVLKNWQGTRLPTFNDFFGFCGSKGGDDGGSGYETDCDSATTIGKYGHQIGRTDECMDLSDTSYEWLSERYNYGYARMAGIGACSYVGGSNVSADGRFRAVFRP